jgi:hypothetical protein
MQRTEGANFGVDVNGNRIYVETPLPTTITADAMNSIQEELCNAIEASGQEVQTSATDTYTQLAAAIQTVATVYSLVFSQISFNAIWERTAPNEYRIKNNIGSVYIRNILGGYRLAGIGSPLSDGDTWGRYRTNNAVAIIAEGGTTLEKLETKSYVEVNTPNAKIENIVLNTTGVTRLEHEYGFLVSAGNVEMKGCGIQGFRIEGNFVGFEFGGNSVCLEDCFINNINYDDSGAANFTGFNDSGLNTSCFRKVSVRNSTIKTNGTMVLFNGLKNMNQVLATNIQFQSYTANTGMGKICYQCEKVSFSTITLLSGAVVNNKIICFDDCKKLNNIDVDIQVTNDWAGEFKGFYQCYFISNVKWVGGRCRRLMYCFDTCDNINGVEVSDWVDAITNIDGSYGIFLTCNFLNNIYIDNINIRKSGAQRLMNMLNFVSNVRINNIQASPNTVYVFDNSKHLTNLNVQNCNVQAGIYIVANCNYNSNSFVDFIESTSISLFRAIVGFFNANYVSSTFVGSNLTSVIGGNAGFNECENISSTHTITEQVDCNYVDDGDSATVVKKFSARGF